MRILLLLLAALIGVPVVAAAVVWIGLNTGYGRSVAVAEMNRLAGPQVEIAGLAGHFPADVRLRRVTLSDARGVYAAANDVELRWRPQEILRRRVAVTRLTAGSVTVARAPVTGKASKGGMQLPAFQLDVAHAAVGALHVGAALAGQDLTLAVEGHLRLSDLEHGDVGLEAVAAEGRGSYRLDALIDPQRVDLHARIDEPPDGLIGHLAGPGVHAPLQVVVGLAGERDDAQLDFSARLGEAALEGSGSVGLDPKAPWANVVLTVPSLAPAAAFAGEKLSGRLRAHLVAAERNMAATVTVDGDVDLAAGPGPAAALVGPAGTFSASVRLAHGQVTVDRLQAAGAGFAVAARGVVTRRDVDLKTQLLLKNVALLSPGIAGKVSVDGQIAGTAKDFAVDAKLAGDVTRAKIPSGPFAVVVDVRHLPAAPAGTITGGGTLEGDPLRLDAAFGRDSAGGISAAIRQSSWRSLSASGNFSIRPGTSLPFGDAKFAVGNLADLSAFVPQRLSGSLRGDFSHLDSQRFALDLTVKNLVAAPGIGAIDGQVSASGPETALAVRLRGSTDKLLNAPGRVALAGLVDARTRAGTISSLDASWRGLDVRLLGPAALATEPGLSMRHAALAVDGGTITLDGSLTPRLNLSLAAQHLPARLAALAAPVKASGFLNLSAALSGTLANPAGSVTVDAEDVKLHQGAAESLPAADFAADMQVAGRTVNLNAKLSLGADVSLAADGLVPLSLTGPVALHLTGSTDLRLLDPITAAEGTTIRGVVTPDVTVSGTPAAPAVDGTVTLSGGSAADLESGLSLTRISARIGAAGRLIDLRNFAATAGGGTISGHGTIDLSRPDWPIDLALAADDATPVSSDLATESANASLTLKGGLRGAMALAGTIDLLRANINIPKSLPPSVADLPILNEGETPPPPAPPPPDIALDLTIAATNQIFIRGDGLFAELGGKVRLAGTARNPQPQGGFTLIRGTFALPGKTVQFTSGTVNFTGDGFVPTLDLEASTTTSNNTTATLIIGGTAEKPTITLTASPPLPSDEVLSELLFGEATSSLSPFQAASLAAALASLSGVGGSAVSDPLGGVRGALGLDQLSLGDNGGGAPTVNAGRYVAPGVYVGAQQSTTGQGTQATVDINLLKGLQLQTSTGTSAAGAGNSSSVGLTYQFNY